MLTIRPALLLAAFASGISLLGATDRPTDVPAGWFVWPVVTPATGSALDNSKLNATPAGASGFVSVQNSKFVAGDGRPLRFFGVNIPAADNFRSPADMEELAERLAKAGVNIARLHHLDNPWGSKWGDSIWANTDDGRHVIAPAQLDKLHVLIATLARHGIYSNLNLKVSKQLSPADGFPESVAKLPDFQKRVDMFDRRMIELQKDYARQLLTTRNPHTGHAPVDDPAVAIVEINNENSILGYFTRDLGRGAENFPEPFREELRQKWNLWLQQKYPDAQSLATAWKDHAEKQTPSVIPASSKWGQNTAQGCVLKFKPGRDSTSMVAEVKKTTGLNWNIQISHRDLPLKDNAVYTLTFEIKGQKAGSIGIGIANDNHERPDEPWRSLGLLQPVDVSKEWKQVSLVAALHSVANSRGKLNFDIGGAANRIEIRKLRMVEGASAGGLGSGQDQVAGTVPLPSEPTTKQWTDWLSFLSDLDRSFAEEMRDYLRKEIGVRVPMVCSQINFSGVTAYDRERSSDFADVHNYWQHPNFPDGKWDSPDWSITNTPQLAVAGPRSFGCLSDLAFHRVEGKPFSVSEYDHAAPNEYVCEMYPSLALFACRQDWDALYPFDMGTYGKANPDHRISSFFDQINHPAKWSLALFATRVFREGLVPPAGKTAVLYPRVPAWSDALHFDMLWAKCNPTEPFDFLDTRLMISEKSAPSANLVRGGKADPACTKVVSAPQGHVLIADIPQAAAACGFLGGASISAGPLTVECKRFGNDFAAVTAIALDGQKLTNSHRILVTIVARAENSGMKWNATRTSVGKEWGHGPTIAERVPATITLDNLAGRKVYALAPDGSRSHEVAAQVNGSKLSFTTGPSDNTLFYEVLAP